MNYSKIVSRSPIADNLEECSQGNAIQFYMHWNSSTFEFSDWPKTKAGWRWYQVWYTSRSQGTSKYHPKNLSFHLLSASNRIYSAPKFRIFEISFKNQSQEHRSNNRSKKSWNLLQKKCIQINIRLKIIAKQFSYRLFFSTKFYIWEAFFLRYVRSIVIYLKRRKQLLYSLRMNYRYLPVIRRQTLSDDTQY